MNFNIINNNKYVVKINSSLITINEKNQASVIKDILINIKKRYGLNIYGDYDVDIYKIDNLLSIIVFNKKNIDGLFYNTIDLKIKNHSKSFDIIINDFTIINNNRINSKKINSKDIYKICEHYFIEKLDLLYK